MTMMTDIGSAEWKRLSAALAVSKEQQTGYGFCDYEIRSVNGEGGSLDIAMDALDFDFEHLGSHECLGVASCRHCGGLYKDHLWSMRRHRLACGWK